MFIWHTQLLCIIANLLFGLVRMCVLHTFDCVLVVYIMFLFIVLSTNSPFPSPSYFWIANHQTIKNKFVLPWKQQQSKILIKLLTFLSFFLFLVNFTNSVNNFIALGSFKCYSLHVHVVSHLLYCIIWTSVPSTIWCNDDIQCLHAHQTTLSLHWWCNYYYYISVAIIYIFESCNMYICVRTCICVNYPVNLCNLSAGVR